MKIFWKCRGVKATGGHVNMHTHVLSDATYLANTEASNRRFICIKAPFYGIFPGAINGGFRCYNVKLISNVEADIVRTILSY